MANLISLSKSVIPACDVSSKKAFETIIQQTCDVRGISAYKVGAELVIRYGLKALVEAARQHTTLPIIYDHQKGGTDIPEFGIKFADACRSAGIEYVILFPFGGAATEREWIQSSQRVGLNVIVGGHMTQKEFLQSEGGFLSDAGPQKIYEIAVDAGVADFVVPGNKPEWVLKYKEFFDKKNIDYTLYAPGFIKQGGTITDCGKVAGDKWHAIVGSAIYNSENMQKSAEELTREIV